MTLIKQFLKLKIANNIVALVAFSISIFITLLIYIIFSYNSHLNTMESVIHKGEFISKKMQLNSELMEISRTRSRLTIQLID